MTEPQTKAQELLLAQILLDALHLCADWSMGLRLAYLIEQVHDHEAHFTVLESRARRRLQESERLLDAALE
jgi:hypothetical protein